MRRVGGGEIAFSAACAVCGVELLLAAASILSTCSFVAADAMELAEQDSVWLLVHRETAHGSQPALHGLGDGFVEVTLDAAECDDDSSGADIAAGVLGVLDVVEVRSLLLKPATGLAGSPRLEGLGVCDTSGLVGRREVDRVVAHLGLEENRQIGDGLAVLVGHLGIEYDDMADVSADDPIL